MLFGYIFTWTLLLPYLRCCATVLAAYRNEPTEFKPISISTAKPIARLPNMTRPLSYYLELKVDSIEADKFYGTTIIHIKVLEDTQTIVLHSKYLTILTAGFLKSNKDNKVTWVYDRENEFLIMEIQSEKNQKLKKNENEALKISYTGKIRDDNVGLFRKVYYDGSGEKKFLIATQFAPTYARLVFPCYDEPGFKATFSLKITHSRKYDVFSSSPKDSPTIDNIDGSRSTNFQITPEISTYLLSFAVGDFQITESQTAINKIAIIARPDFKHQLTYALEISPHILQGFEKYLDRKLPFTKIDNLAVPSPKYTAMENVGLVVFDENVLMTRPRRSLKHEITIALTIAHEYAHQWFGNLVTPVWWSYFWLNEGMAALLEYNILAKQNVDWDMDQQFIINRLQPALEADAEQNHHPLTFWPKQTKEIEKVFETLSYNKGASIFRMIQHVLTEHSFREALKKYITDCQWKSVTPTDLFHYFNEAAVRNTIFENADIDFEPFLTSWTQQAGYPLVTVTRDYQSGTFRINQEPFDTILKPQKDDKRIWWIPFNFITNNGTFQTTTLDGYLDGSGEQTISPAVKMWNNNDWLILNKQQTGFYRVNYDVKNWIMLIQDINKNPEIIHVNNRAQLIDDAVHLVFVNRLQPSILFNLLKYLIKEDEYAPWKTFEKIYFRLRHHLSEHQDSALFNDFVKDIVSVPYERFEILDSPKEKKSRQLTRNIIINLACQSGYKECLTEVKAQLNNILLSQEAKMNNDLRNTILRNGMISATHLDFSLVLSLLVKSKDTDERQEYMTALGCMQEPSLIRLYLTTAMKRTFDINYSYTERLYVLKSVIQGSSKGLVVAIDFLNGNTIEYSKINAGDKNALYEAIREIGHFIVTKKLNTDFSRLLKKIERHGLLNKEDMKPVEYTIQKNLDWTSRNRKPLVDWLNAYTFEKKSRATTKTGGKVRLSISFLVFMMCHVVSLVVM